MSERLNIEGLRYAQAVAQTNSFSAAARAYGVTQPALSNGIAKLEERLGERLFDRSPRGVAQTPFGARILPLINGALTALDRVTAESNRWNAPEGGTIRLGVSPLINPKLIASAYSAVCRPAVLSEPRNLVLREANMEELRDGLADGDLDLIFIPSVAPMPRYEHRIIDSEPMVLVDSAPLCADPVEVDALGETQLILVPDACGLTRFTHGLFQSHELPLHAYPGEASSYRVLEEWANLGLGSAVVPRSKLASPEAPHRPLLDSGQEVEIFYEAVWDPKSPLASDLAILAEQLGNPS
ncbi:LysR family transcriptional regulator [Zafaria cholistanensis]|uniref:LysR family transcriptional regulator n=1 Tax=Zafaria cholistanensis TaxID=1682741 RepID=A0A5A7NV29_9MICC|nr:LysR family transcriptional regulator [Zafaria cholistanensis]GER23887.1 LysR family transcriptional regulator [Zafaria cholistanensis]